MLQWKIWGAWIIAIIHKGREDGYTEWASINPNMIEKLESLDSPCHSLPASVPQNYNYLKESDPEKTANVPNENSNHFSRGILTRGVTLIFALPRQGWGNHGSFCVKMRALSFHWRARRLPTGSGRRIERKHFIIKGTFYRDPELGCEGWGREEMVVRGVRWLQREVKYVGCIKEQQCNGGMWGGEKATLQPRL